MLAVLRHRDFRLLWASQVVSVVGDALVIVAIGLFVTRRTGSAGDVGIVLAAYSLPLVVFVLLGGVIADRLPRQLVMTVSDAIRAVLHGTLAILIATGVVQVWHMVVIGVLFGSAEAFFRPAYTGLVPRTVPREEIQSAAALGGLPRELAAFASPALATALVLGLGADWAFGLDAATFVVSALLLARIGVVADEPVTERSSVLAEFGQGWRALTEARWAGVMIASFCVCLLTAMAPFLVLGATLSRRHYGTEAVYGWATAALGVGTVVGVLIASRWRPRRPAFTAMIAVIGWPAVMAIYASGVAQPVLYPLVVAGGIGTGLFGVWWETALAENIPADLLSRVSAWDWMGSLALVPVGYLITGPVADALGATEVAVGGGVIGTAAFLVPLFSSSVRSLRRVEPA